MTGRHLAAVTATVFAALTSTLLCRLFVAWVLTSAPWDELFYVQWFVFLAFVALWSVVLFPRETRALADALASKGWFVPLAQLAVLAVVAALLVSCGDFAFEWAGASAMGTVLKGEVIWKRAWLTSSIILFAVYALTFAATSRLTTTVILISPVYVGFVIASVIKVNYMDTAVHPLDLLRIPEFVPFFHKFFGTQGIVAGVRVRIVVVGGHRHRADAGGSCESHGSMGYRRPRFRRPRDGAACLLAGANFLVARSTSIARRTRPGVQRACTFSRGRPRVSQQFARGIPRETGCVLGDGGRGGSGEELCRSG